MKINLQTAKLAKEKGFEIKGNQAAFMMEEPDLLVLPQQDEIQTWLRNKHNIHLEIPIGRDENKLWFDYSLYSMTRPVEYEEEAYEAIAYSAEGFDTYEEALEEALKVGLTLIDKND